MIIWLTPCTPNLHSLKMDVLPKSFLQIILTAKWQAGHSSTSPKQQRRPLPSLLYVSSSMLQGMLVSKINKFQSSFLCVRDISDVITFYEGWDEDIVLTGNVWLVKISFKYFVFTLTYL